MIIIKEIDEKLQLTNIKDVYLNENDMKKKLIELCKDKYVNKCYKSCKILDILDIIEMSEINFTDDLECYNYINCKIKVKAYYINKYEIIPDVQLLNKDNFGNIGYSNHCSVFINKNKEIGAIKNNNYLPITVDLARYNLGSGMISIIGSILLPTRKDDIIYKINNKLNKNENMIINSLLDRNNNEILSWLNNQNKNNKELFNRLDMIFYPYKIFKKFNTNIKIGNKIFKIKNFENLNKITDGYLYSPPKMIKSQYMFYYSNILPIADNNESDNLKVKSVDTFPDSYIVRSLNLFDILQEYINLYYFHMIFIKYLIENNLGKKLSTYINIYKRNKI
tara:strand:- start:773 stop:1780 length:1008 start_codon:yes stop_codon:yes gene_type:complete